MTSSPPPSDLPLDVASLMSNLTRARPAQFRLWERACADDVTLTPERDAFSRIALGLYVGLPSITREVAAARAGVAPAVTEVEWVQLLAELGGVDLYLAARIWRAVAPHLAAEPEAFPGLAVVPAPADESV
jgi:hypothetical protein